MLKHPRRPRDPNQLAKTIVDLATGERLSSSHLLQANAPAPIVRLGPRVPREACVCRSAPFSAAGFFDRYSTVKELDRIYAVSKLAILIDVGFRTRAQVRELQKKRRLAQHQMNHAAGSPLAEVTMQVFDDVNPGIPQMWEQGAES